jgi:hypothetical protein
LGGGGGEGGCCERGGGEGVLHDCGVVGGMRVGVYMCRGGVLLGLIAKTVDMQMQDNKRKPSSRTRGLAGLIYYLPLLKSKRLTIIRCQLCVSSPALAALPVGEYARQGMRRPHDAGL